MTFGVALLVALHQHFEQIITKVILFIVFIRIIKKTTIFHEKIINFSPNTGKRMGKKGPFSRANYSISNAIKINILMFFRQFCKGNYTVSYIKSLFRMEKMDIFPAQK